MEIRDSNLEGLHQELGKRFEALSKLFGELSSPPAAKELLDSLTLPDAPMPWGQFVAKLGGSIPNLNKLELCYWLHEVMTKVIKTGKLVDEYRLRNNLTFDESALLFQLSWRHRKPTSGGGRFPWELPNTAGAIAAGPFLDALKANGLVTFMKVEEIMEVTYLVKGEYVCR